jgi:predicted ATP-dependent protease
MDHRDVRTIRGALTRKEFAGLLGVTPLTILRWELAEGTKEARHPRANMVEKLRRLAADGVGQRGPGAPGDMPDDDDTDASDPVSDTAVTAAPPDDAFERDWQRVMPLLDRVATAAWARAEDELLGLLASDTLETPGGRALASIGCAQVQLMGRLDGRATFATLGPILRSVDRDELPSLVAARAHVIAAYLFALLDSRFFNPGRVNAHAARAEELLGNGEDDQRILLTRARVAAVRFADPHAGLRIYQDATALLARASSPLARMVAAGLRGYAAHVRGDGEAAASTTEAALALADLLSLNGIMVVLLADRVQRMARGAFAPEAILEMTRMGRERAAAGRVTTSEAYLVILAAEIEALCRSGRAREAAAVADEAMRIGQEGGIARYCLAMPIARLYILLSRAPDIGSLADTLEAENAGTHGGLANVHALAVRALAAGLAGDLEASIALGERVCGAPEGTIGLQYVTDDAHMEVAYSKLLLHDIAGAEVAIRRCEAALTKHPSVRTSGWVMRLRGYLLFQQGRFAEARQKFEAAAATFAMAGDSVHEAYCRGLLAASTRAAATHDVEQLATDIRAIMARYEVAPEQAQRILSLCMPMVHADWHEPSLTERLAVAVDRLSVQGLRPEVLPRELASILGSLFPGRQILVERGAPVEPGDEVVDVEGDAGLRIGVRGALDPDQRAALRLLATVTPLALRGSRGAADREVAVDAVAPGFIAAAPATRRLKADVVQLSRSSSTVLVLGESGTGKEVVARAVHDLSPRAARPYVVFNCASVPRELFESQLFGHRRGSFTGAAADSPGVIRAADGGTLFLDEIGELPLDMQPKLLRFLENGEVLPIGEQRARRVDVRILAATHRDLARQVREGQFREDLFYRLNVVPLRVPPLRERAEDIIVLARFFIARLAPAGTEAPELASDAVAALRAHTWPGNVRELRNVIERAMAYAPIPSLLHAEQLRIG